MSLDDFIAHGMHQMCPRRQRHQAQVQAWVQAWGGVWAWSPWVLGRQLRHLLHRGGEIVTGSGQALWAEGLGTTKRYSLLDPSLLSGDAGNM